MYLTPCHYAPHTVKTFNLAALITALCIKHLGILYPNYLTLSPPYAILSATTE